MNIIVVTNPGESKCKKMFWKISKIASRTRSFRWSQRVHDRLRNSFLVYEQHGREETRKETFKQTISLDWGWVVGDRVAHYAQLFNPNANLVSSNCIFIYTRYKGNATAAVDDFFLPLLPQMIFFSSYYCFTFYFEYVFFGLLLYRSLPAVRSLVSRLFAHCTHNVCDLQESESFLPVSFENLQDPVADSYARGRSLTRRLGIRTHLNRLVNRTSINSNV